MHVKEMANKKHGFEKLVVITVTLFQYVFLLQQTNTYDGTFLRK